MDIALGGPSNPQPANSAPPPEVIRATIAALPVTPTVYVPAATDTPTPGPTAVPGVVAQQRDQQRLEDLAKIKAALEQYRNDKGEYPSTGGNIQTACTYKDIDALCELGDLLDPIPTDPMGDPVDNGYWYISDGKTFTIIAGMDSPANALPAKCAEGVAQHTKKSNLYCLTGP